MKHNYKASYGRVALRPLSSDDSRLLRELRNRNSSRFFDATQITEEAQARWYAEYLKKENDYMFSVILQSEQKWVGAVSIYQVDPSAGSAEFGRLVIDREAVNERGLGVDATLAACAFAFEELGLETVTLEVFEDNIPAVRTYEKAGFVLNQTIRSDRGNVLCMSKKA